MPLIPAPQKISFHSTGENQGEFIIEPLYPGYGLTVGNSLRRVLFSSMPGAAVTAVKINGADHEFSTLPYVKEDVVDILLNIKQIKLKIEGEMPETPLILKLEKKGAGQITAGDIQCPTQVTIANKDLVLLTMTDKAASLEIEFCAEKGMGYLPTEARGHKEKLAIGHIAVDAIFTPIVNVSMKIEHVRVGEMTNWDKLILNIETNGVIDCEQAFDLAVDILLDNFSALKKRNISQEDDPSGSDEEQSLARISDAEKNGQEKEETADNQSDDDESQNKDGNDSEKTPGKKRGRPKKS